MKLSIKNHNNKEICELAFLRPCGGKVNLREHIINMCSHQDMEYWQEHPKEFSKWMKSSIITMVENCDFYFIKEYESKPEPIYGLDINTFKQVKIK